MEFTVTCKCEANSIEELAAKLSQIEGNRRSRSHVQSVVGPHDAAISRGESGRWPDRLTIQGIKRMVEVRLREMREVGYSRRFREAIEEQYDKILTDIEELDKGAAVATRQDAEE